MVSIATLKDMSSEAKSPQSQSVAISSSQISGQIGLAGQNLNQAQVDQTISSGNLTSEQVIQLLSQIEDIVRMSKISDTQKQSAIHYLGSAKEEAQQPQPDKDFAAKNVKRAAEIVKSTNETLSAGQGVFEKIKPLIEKLLPWLGVVKGFLGL